MIFQHTWQQVLSGEKTQTRRLVEDNDEEVRPLENNPSWPDIFCALRFSQGYPTKGRAIYKVGKTYSVQPGRGQASVGRIKLLAIRRERVQDITPDDCYKEGSRLIYKVDGEEPVILHPHQGDADIYYIQGYSLLWDRIHTAKGERWNDNPEVWVLIFELCKGGER